jgi:superfamily II DNA helicase RecQ
MNSGTISKIFVDEAHTFLEDAHFHPVMRQLQVLSMFGPIVALSAICSPEVVEDLLSNLFPSNQSPVIVRQASNRHNLVYKFLKVYNEAQASMLVKNALGDLKDDERIILFCPTKKTAEMQSLKFNCVFINSDLGDEARIDNSNACIFLESASDVLLLKKWESRICVETYSRKDPFLSVCIAGFPVTVMLKGTW